MSSIFRCSSTELIIELPLADIGLGCQENAMDPSRSSYLGFSTMVSTGGDFHFQRTLIVSDMVKYSTMSFDALREAGCRQ